MRDSTRHFVSSCRRLTPSRFALAASPLHYSDHTGFTKTHPARFRLKRLVLKPSSIQERFRFQPRTHRSARASRGRVARPPKGRACLARLLPHAYARGSRPAVPPRAACPFRRADLHTHNDLVRRTRDASRRPRRHLQPHSRARRQIGQRVNRTRYAHRARSLRAHPYPVCPQRGARGPRADGANPDGPRRRNAARAETGRVPRLAKGPRPRRGRHKDARWPQPEALPRAHRLVSQDRQAWRGLRLDRRARSD